MIDEAAALLAQIQCGDKIGAIKRVRELTGSSLIEAKDAVEQIRTVADAQKLLIGVRSAPQPRIGLSQGVDVEVRKLALDGQRIAAIKLLRERSGLDLRSAKHLLDRTVPPLRRYRGLWIFWGLFFVVMLLAAGFVLLQA